MSRTPGPNGKCAACRHADRYRVELILAGGARVLPTARRFGIHGDALRRHWLNHVSAERKSALIAGPMKLTELAERAAREGESLLDHFVILRNQLYAAIDSAAQAGDRQQIGQLAGRAIECLRAMGNLNGQLLRGSVNLTQNILINPVFVDLQATLVSTLADFPEARAAVVRAFRNMEASAQAAVPAPEGRYVEEPRGDAEAA
jgi:hypothetical protein